jgi:uncharacterized protein (TIGR03083 family)
MDHTEHCTLLAQEIATFADVVDGADMSVPVGPCPGWSLEDLVLHLGTIHRWAAHLVRTVSPRYLPSSAVDLAGARPSAEWVMSGGQALVQALRSADPGTPMWAWGADQHVRFWSRRQLHETLVHRVDAQLALGLEPTVNSAVAADGVDELLVNLGAAVTFSPSVANLTGQGEVLRFRATDEGRAWDVRLVTDGFEVMPGAAEAPTTCLEGPSAALLLVLYRRAPLSSSGLALEGREGLAQFWLENSALL